jgi:dCMP deaminase
MHGMTQPARKRPDRDDYYMHIAMAVRRRAACSGNKVGAIIVLRDRIISTGYNGTPAGMQNCDQGGCYRCANRDKFASGAGYDICICVHAEQNALLSAARFGISVEGATMYTTMRPCFGCTKELLQARVPEVVYMHDWAHPDPAIREEYEKIQNNVKLRRLDIEDPEKSWSVNTKVPPPQS